MENNESEKDTSDIVSLNNTKTIDDENIKQQIAFTMQEAENNLMDIQSKIQSYKKDQIYRCKQIKKSVDIASKNKAILSLKYGMQNPQFVQEFSKKFLFNIYLFKINQKTYYSRYKIP